MQRFDVLRNLIILSRPLEDLTADLSQLSWDYEGDPLVVNASQIKEILLRYLNGDISARELEQWANLIECREDLEFEERHHDAIENTIYCLANPSLQGAISSDACQVLLKTLD